MPFIWGTLYSSVLALLIAAPIALGIAVFISELSPAWLRNPLVFVTELLAAIPSIFYGLWGIFVLGPIVRQLETATPDSLRLFVADPSQGSRHNRGAAVDLTLYDRSTGQPVEMPGVYDEFSPRSFPHYPGGTSRQRWHRELLRQAMEVEGFAVYPAEWWHFDYGDWRRFRIGNSTFEELGR